jgi:hypothetical protein
MRESVAELIRSNCEPKLTSHMLDGRPVPQNDLFWLVVGYETKL